MGKQLAATVHVMNPDTGLNEIFLAGSTPPKWAADLITNPGAWQTEEQQGAVSEDGPPPRSGSGSGRARWVEFAESQGVEVDDEATKDDIISLLEASGVIEGA